MTKRAYTKAVEHVVEATKPIIPCNDQACGNPAIIAERHNGTILRFCRRHWEKFMDDKDLIGH